MVGDGQRVAVAPVAELELALEVGAPQIIGRGALGQRRAARAVARPAAALDQAVAIENRMDGALGRNPDIAVEPPDQELADLARAPVRLLGLQPDDQALDLLRQLVGIAHRPARPIAQGRKPVLLVAIENLVAGLAGYPEIPADVRHGLPVQQAGDKAKAFFHHRTRFPRHPHLPPAKGEKCYPCVRYEMSPMSRAAHGVWACDVTSRDSGELSAIQLGGSGRILGSNPTCPASQSGLHWATATAMARARSTPPGFGVRPTLPFCKAGSRSRYGRPTPISVWCASIHFQSSSLEANGWVRVSPPLLSPSD